MSARQYLSLSVVTLWWIAWLVTSATVNPACRCVQYQSLGRSEGLFTSPNFPKPYKDNITCLLYTFSGLVGEIVELTFIEFQLPEPAAYQTCSDVLTLYLELEVGGVNEQTKHQGQYCGRQLDGRTRYSSRQHLVLFFHTDSHFTNNTGFQGRYRFLDKRQFQNDGKEVSPCHYVFHPSGKNGSGRFFSPGYPRQYGRNLHCSYTFSGKSGQAVQITFDKVSLEDIDQSCLMSPDKVLVYDGKTSSSPVIGRLCGVLRHGGTSFISSGPHLVINFISDNTQQGQGFRGRYKFLSTYMKEAAVVEEKEPPKDEVAQVEKDTSSGWNGHKAVDCNKLFQSHDSRNGTVKSPGYPGPYPAGLECSYTFMARGADRVKLIFKDFDLYKQPNSEPDDCQGEDVVIPAIEIDGEQTNIQTYCGNSKLPPALMSSGPHMTLTFKSQSKVSNRRKDVRGFLAAYEFVNDFGIDAERSDEHPCGFIFNSSKQSAGTFTSPNYPGLYPRNIECHYFFYGRTMERIRLTFAYFDVEGIYPCRAETDSDYVEFSNFQTVDRKMPRHCGYNQGPGVVLSDGDFFRVTFKSNHLFDGTGFEAFYQFFNKTDPDAIRKPSAPSSRSDASTNKDSTTNDASDSNGDNSVSTTATTTTTAAMAILALVAISNLIA